MIFLISLGLYYYKEIESNIELFIVWVSNHPFLGPLAIALVYILAETMFFPRTILTVGTGFAFMEAYDSVFKSLLVGMPTVVLAASVGSIIHFTLGRYIFQSEARKVASKYPIIGAIDKALEKQGFLLMTLLHASPIVPFGILNFVVGITSMKFKDFCLSMVGIVPGSFVQIMVGTTFKDASDIISGHSSPHSDKNTELIVMIIGTIIGCGGIIWTSFVAKKYFDEIIS